MIDNENRAEMNELKLIRDYIFGGHATFTLVGKADRFTYRVRTLLRWEQGTPRPYFVDVLSGPDNTSDYQFLGTFRNAGDVTYTHSAKSRVTPEAKSVQGAMWLARTLNRKDIVALPEGATFYHEGVCARCGRKLTTPESIQLGIGPVCATKHK